MNCERIQKWMKKTWKTFRCSSCFCSGSHGIPYYEIEQSMNLCQRCVEKSNGSNLAVSGSIWLDLAGSDWIDLKMTTVAHFDPKNDDSCTLSFKNERIARYTRNQRPQNRSGSSTLEQKPQRIIIINIGTDLSPPVKNEGGDKG